MAHDPEHIHEHVARQRAALPEAPGVYTYYDVSGRVLYVGKAKNLKKRVSSYFTKALDARRHALVMRIADIEVFEVSSEREALRFEAQLIKRHKPPFNVMLRDDKSYPWIVVTLGDEFPRVMFTRERRRNKPGARYFGPYSSAKRLRATLDLLNRVFPYRPCEGPQPGRQSGIPCLDYHIDRCAAPCVGYINQADYRAIIDEVMDVLRGKAGPVRRRLEADMHAAAAELEFERAARLRNRLADLDQILQLQQTERPGEGSFDVLGVATGDELANVQLLQVRDGIMHDRRSHFLDQVEGLQAGEVLTQFALSHYVRGAPIPPLLVAADAVLDDEQVEMIEEALTRVRGAGVAIRMAQRGDKRRLVDLAMRNADHALSFDSLKQRTTIERRAQGLEELRDALGLENLPLRIECYDISNLQEQAPVASMVVLEDGRPRKDHYRKFAMRHAGGQDDFAMMNEVITRRFARLARATEAGVERHSRIDDELVTGEADEQAEAIARNGTPADATADHLTAAPETTDHDESFSSVPDLVIIDGGKGQLSSAVAALHDSGVERVAICSLAKQEELVYLPGVDQPIVLARGGPALHLVQRIRDEAHRFALGYHRTRRSAEARGERGSVLDTLRGVGDARRRALLVFFGSPERVISATLDELQAVPGLPAKTARSIYEQLHRLGGSGLSS